MRERAPYGEVKCAICKHYVRREASRAIELPDEFTLLAADRRKKGPAGWRIGPYQPTRFLVPTVVRVCLRCLNETEPAPAPTCRERAKDAWGDAWVNQEPWAKLCPPAYRRKP